MTAQTGDTTMFTKTTIALAIILGTASLAIAKEPKTSPVMPSFSGATYGNDGGRRGAGERVLRTLQQRNLERGAVDFDAGEVHFRDPAGVADVVEGIGV